MVKNLLLYGFIVQQSFCILCLHFSSMNYLEIGNDCNTIISNNCGFRSTCSQPIHIWTILAIVQVSILRSLLIIMENTQSPRVFKLTAQIILFVFFPIFVFGTVLGTLWYQQIHKTTPKCLGEDTQWIIIFWLSISYFLLFTYLATLLTLMLEKVIHV